MFPNKAIDADGFALRVLRFFRICLNRRNAGRRDRRGTAFFEVLEARTGRDIDTVFASLAQKPIDALVVGP